MRIILLFICLAAAMAGYAQSLPLNTCGIVYSYDAAGNRTQRKYVCNNARLAYAPESKTEAIEQVTTLYPNPTTGRFKITFTQALQNATVVLTDVSGRVIEQSQKSGTVIELDLSKAAAGMYLVQVKDRNTMLSQKVIKQ